MLRFVLLGCVVAAFIGVPVLAQSTPEPDLIVGDLTDTDVWGPVNAITAYSIGTVIQNVGTAPITWSPGTSNHPVIAHNLYRLKNGRFQHIGMSWVVHPGSALGSGPCTGAAGTILNPGCSVAIGALTSGAQSLLGPRFQVNPWTGVFTYPTPFGYPAAASVIDRRLQVLTSDINPMQNQGARYFVEAQVIHPEDAASGALHNNCSYREATVTPGTHDLVFTGPTHTMQPAIEAWKDVDPAVQLVTVDVPGDGRLLVGFKGTPIGTAGNYRYGYAVQNVSCWRGVAGVAIETWPIGINPGDSYCATAMPVYAPTPAPFHSGEAPSNAPWKRSLTPLEPGCFCGAPFISPLPDAVVWKPPLYGAQTPTVLYWGSLYNLEMDAPELPGFMLIELAGPDAPTTITIPAFDPPRRPVVKYTVESVDSAQYDFVDISTTGSPGPIGNDTSFAVPIGFTFPYYSNLYTHVVISTNGYLTFPGQNGNLAANTTLPDSGGPQGMIAGYWDDLDCSDPFDIRYKTLNNRFIVCWNCNHAGDAQPLKFELILEPNGDILNPTVQCSSGFLGGSATRGLEAPTGSEGVQFAFNTYGSASPGQTVIYRRSSVSTNLFLHGKPPEGPFTITYVGMPDSPVVTMVAVGYEPTNLGILGVLPVNLLAAVGISDYLGILTGVPDPTAITNSEGVHEFTFSLPPGILPTGLFIPIRLGGVSFPPNPADAFNGWFNISNSCQFFYF